MTIASSGTVFNGTYLSGIVLNNPTDQNPATIAAGAYVTNTTTMHAGVAVYGSGFPWTVANFGTIAGSDGVLLTAGGAVANSASGSPNAIIKGAFDAVLIEGTTGTVVNFGTLSGGTNGAGVGLQAGGGVTNGQSGSSQGLIQGALNGVLIGAMAGSIANFGTIADTGATGFGVHLLAGGRVTNGGSGSPGALIEGAESGVEIDGTTGYVFNFGTIAGIATGTSSGGAYLRRGGTIINYAGGLITGVNLGFAIFNTAGYVANFGTVAATGTSGTGAVLGVGGTIVNKPGGLISGIEAGVAISHAGGSVANYGTIEGYALGVKFGSAGAYVATSGSIEATGTASTGAFLAYGGLIANKGVITGVRLGADIGIGGGTLFNTGTIAAGLARTPSVGIYFSAGGNVRNGQSGSPGGLVEGYGVGVKIAGTGAYVANFGTIAGTGSASVAAYLTDGGVVVNNTGGQIQGVGGGVVISHAGGTVANDGTIAATGAGTISTGASLTDGGVILNRTAGAVIAGAHLGAVIALGGGTILNLGTIAATATIKPAVGIYFSDGGDVRNGESGSSGGLVEGYGVGIKIAAAGAYVANFGTIAGTGAASAGAYLTNGGTVINDAGGLIAGVRRGVDIVHTDGTVDNLGAIEGIGPASDGVYLQAGGSVVNQKAGIIAGSLGGIRISGAGTATNYGNVAASATNGVGIYLLLGTVTNFGTIVGGADGYAVAVRYGVFVNQGLVSGAVAGIQLGGTAGSGTLGSGKVTVAGTVTGAVGISAAPAISNYTVTVSGAVIGTGGTAVDLGPGGDRLILAPSEVFSGVVDGGTQGSALELAAGAGTGRITGLGSSFVGFGNIQLDAKAVWRFTGGNTLAGGGSTLSNAGTLEVQGNLIVGGALANTGTIVIEAVGPASGGGPDILVPATRLDLQHAGQGNGPIVFTASGETLVIGQPGQPAALGNPVKGFQAGDTIDVAGVVANAFTYSGGVLTLENGMTPVAHLTLSLANPAVAFRLGADGQGGTTVELAPLAAPHSTSGATLGLLGAGADLAGARGPPLLRYEPGLLLAGG